MSRQRKLETLDDFRRALKNKYGLGREHDYKPWVRVQDVPSVGNSAKIFGLKSKRDHHMLSEHESCFFYIAEFCDQVIDIREQFPLLPIDLSVRISKTLGLKHPVIPRTKSLSVMTTDFLLTCSDGEKVWYEAVSAKPSNQLSNLRSAEKLEIERTWWQLLGVPFHIFTKTAENQIISQNIQWITAPLRRNNRVDIGIAELTLSEIKTGTFLISELCTDLSFAINASPDEALLAIKYLLTNKYITAELSKPMLSQGLIEITSISEKRVMTPHVY